MLQQQNMHLLNASFDELKRKVRISPAFYIFRSSSEFLNENMDWVLTDEK